MSKKDAQLNVKKRRSAWPGPLGELGLTAPAKILFQLYYIGSPYTNQPKPKLRRSKILGQNCFLKSITFGVIFEKWLPNWDFDWSSLQLLKNLKPLEKLVCTNLLGICKNLHLEGIYHIIRFKPKSWTPSTIHHQPPTTQIKKKSSGWRVRS